MSVAMLERAAGSLAELTEEVVFAGAATIPLWITDPGAAPLRPTVDVDVLVEAFTLIDYNSFEQRLREAGYEDEGSQIGRFVFGLDAHQLDVIPADPSILGFDNQWLKCSVPVAEEVTLPAGTKIRVLPPANLLATKLKNYVSDRIAGYLRDDRARDAISAHLEYDRGGLERARSVVIPCLEQIAAIGS